MNRSAAMSLAADYFDRGLLQAHLAELVSFRTESQDPTRSKILNDYLSKAIGPRLEAMGFICEIVPNPQSPEFGPFLLGTRIEDPTLPTVLTYGHGDVVLGQEQGWREDLTPFVLREDGQRLYGRGAADNKVQHLINLAALETTLATRGFLGFNVKIIFEMGEEIGSPGLSEMMYLHKDRLGADVFIASDGPRLSAEKPTVFMGSRGGITFDLSVDLREGAHHSGNWGGLLADPAIILAHALATITDERGQLRFPEWRPSSLTPDIRNAVLGLPVGEDDGPVVDTDWGEVGLSPAERAYGWNSFTILAMKSGVPEAPLNAISAKAWARCQLRFVVGTNVEEILPTLRRHLDAAGLQVVQIVQSKEGVFPATRLDLDHPWAKYVAKSVTTSVGTAPHILPNLAGSLPNDCFADILGLPTIWIPHSYLGCNQHAPNEHVLKSVCREAMQVMAGLFWDIGDDAPTPARTLNLSN